MYASYNQSVSSSEDDCANQIKETVKFFNKEELQNLVDNDSKLTELVTENPGVRSLDDEKKTIMAYNKSLAEYNLQLKPKLAEQKASLIQLYVNAQKIQQDFEEHKGRLEELSSQLSLDTTLALLQTESAKSEEDSEVTAEDFLAGNMEVDAFLSLYVEQRTVAHVRKVKVEKLQEIIRTQGSRATSTVYNQPSQPGLYTPPSQQPAVATGYNRSQMSYPIANPGYAGNSFQPNSFAAAMPSLNSYK